MFQWTSPLLHVFFNLRARPVKDAADQRASDQANKNETNGESEGKTHQVVRRMDVMVESHPRDVAIIAQGRYHKLPR